jgi:ADP-ribosylglycohydrolase
LKNKAKENAFIGCIIGTAVGDAMGLTLEGLSPRRALKFFPTLNQYHFLFGKGMVSDDTEHTCFVAQSLIVAGDDVEIYQKTFAWKLRGWLLGLPAGIGFATLRAILKLWFGFPPDKSGVFSAGNGPAMRSPIIGVCYGHNAEKMQQFVRATTRITHTDPKAEFGALAVALAAYLSSLQKTISPQEYLEKFKLLICPPLEGTSNVGLPPRRMSISQSPKKAAEELLVLIQKAVESVLAGQSTADFAKTLGLQKGISGYIYHTVPMVIQVWLKNQDNYQAAIIDIIRCGGDTDTTAAIVGGIIGARVGQAGIPAQWQQNLWEFPRNIKWMEKLGQRLNQVCGGIREQERKILPSPPFRKWGFSLFKKGRLGGIFLSRTFKPQPLPVSLIKVLLRNLIFLVIVLWHGLRRLFPPY